MKSMGTKQYRRICFNACIINLIFFIFASGCQPVYIDMLRDQEKNMKKQVYKNDKKLHVPDSMSGIWAVSETGDRWVLAKNGIIQPVNCTLYPNPVEPEMFLNAEDGKTEEETGENYYRFFGSAQFKHKGNIYFGECRIEIDATGDAVLINGKDGRKE
jgi:hypothetical protein